MAEAQLLARVAGMIEVDMEMTAAMTPRMTITTISSMRVKPRLSFFITMPPF